MADLQAVFERIHDCVAMRMEHAGLPGATILVTDRERTLHLATHGYANLDAREPVRPEHLFEIGSIGKSFTAIALLQLHQEGKLDLHAPVAEYLPWFEVGGTHDPISIHHLLTHTGGIIGVSDVLTDKLFDVWALRHSEATWPPGSRFHYSNVGYKTLGLVLEQIEGSTYGEIIRRRILTPLSMDATDPEITHATRRRLVTGYLPFYDDRPLLPQHGVAPAAWLEIASGDGCISAPIGEMATYLRAIMNRDPRLLTSPSFDLLTGKLVEVEPNHWYGYGIDTDEIDGRTLISHGGEMPGYVCYMFADPDLDLGFIIMASGLGPTFSISMFVHQILVAASNGLPLPDLPELQDRQAIENAGQYAGTYFDAVDGRAMFDLISDGSGLQMERDGARSGVWRSDEGGIVLDHPDYWHTPLHVRDDPLGARVARHGEARYSVGNPLPVGVASTPHDERGQVTGHYRSYGTVFTNFRIATGWDGELLLVHPAGKEEQLHRIDDATWRVEDTPETVRFDTFVDGRALRASFSGCDYYRTFTA